MMKYSAQLIGYTSPTLASLEGPEELIAYCARVFLPEGLTISPA